MPARIIKLPDSMKKTHDLIDGKIVKKKNIECDRSYSDRPKPTNYVQLFAAIVGLSGVVLFTVLVNSTPDTTNSTNKYCIEALEEGDYSTYNYLNCQNR